MSEADDRQRQQQDEAYLITRIAEQEETALSQLYDRYARILYAVAFKILGSIEESEEVVLDVFDQVWRTATRYDAAKGRVDTWLFMITRSRVLDRLRVRQRSTKTQSASLEAEIQSSQVSVDPVEVAILSERRSRVSTALSRLPDQQRQVLELAYYKGLSHSEIAVQTGLSLGTVKTRIRLGLTKLRIALGDWESR
jgi:RNA polymerase sigma factor (sigma-70 family)